MDADFINRVQRSRERARAARQFTDECRQRTAMLVAQAELLEARFDELERRLLLRNVVMRAQQQRLKW